MDAELEMLGDELEEELAEEVEAETTPSYLMPATPSVTPGVTHNTDLVNIPSAPIGNP